MHCYSIGDKLVKIESIREFTKQKTPATGITSEYLQALKAFTGNRGRIETTSMSEGAHRHLARALMYDFGVIFNYQTVRTIDDSGQKHRYIEFSKDPKDKIDRSKPRAKKETPKDKGAK